jgi:hypothetical protein
MATINKIYPHVNVTTRALIRTAQVIADDGATTLFVPFYAKRGLSNEVQKIYNLDQFISEYGEPDYDYQGRTILNIYNWLNAGGAIYALRLVSPDADKASATSAVLGGESMTVTAKHPGEYYNDISVKIFKSEFSTDTVYYMDVEILSGERVIQTIYRLKHDTFLEILNKTKFVDVTFTGTTEAEFKAFLDAVSENTGAVEEISLTAGSDGTFTFEQSLQRFLGSVTEELSISAFEFTPGTGTTVTFTGLSLTNLNWAVNDTISISNGTESYTTTVSAIDTGAGTLTVNVDAENPFDTAADDYTIQFSFSASDYVSISKVLESKLELPIDVIMDPGYSLASKELLKEFSLVRDDIFFYFSAIDFSTSEIGVLRQFDTPISKINQAYYTQKLSVEDVISGKNLWVAPTYFLSRLLPNNDRIYGMQWPTAGLSRGVLVGVQGINENPTSDAKTTYYKERTNYIEKDSRGYKFMSQLTGEPENTALRFINNVRVTNKMIRDLENLGREYLFEFNDATTLSNMRAALNRYVTEWVQNRTLSFADVTVEPDEFSDERVNVTLTIRFTGTIEVISIDITIE